MLRNNRFGMRGVRVVFAVGAGLALTVGCGSDSQYGPADNPTSVTDATGVEFGWRCDERGCRVTLLGSTPAPDPCANPAAAAYSFFGGRFLDICSVCTSTEPGIYWTTTPGQCRILACETNDDCPVVYNWSPASLYECANGLCQNADTVKYPRAVVARVNVEQLCFAARPRSDTFIFSPVNTVVEQSVETSCPRATLPDACPIPPGCRTP